MNSNGEKLQRFGGRVTGPPKLLGMLRVRNEELIIEDTLAHLSAMCDAIVCYDDASTDRTFERLAACPKVAAVIRNREWSPNPAVRLRSETDHRASLLHLANSYKPDWILCADADERFTGAIRGFIESPASDAVDMVRIALFDAYMTPDDAKPYRSGPLLDFRRSFGPERRDIIMLWKAKYPDIRFETLDAKNPDYDPSRIVINRFACQNYGKSISVEQWEATCDYYANYMPYEWYGKKWSERRGKAIHLLSDFGKPLLEWKELLISQSVVL
ncbi:glycosyltransferase family 2 protein [Paenibacillus sp. MBLB4367]|uniref:glycosyltransferase family 2 protein n=1 Tax=Paenibacillus sp. MBLB4367 TaxID=3384767 RepID=UPI0039080BA9